VSFSPDFGVVGPPLSVTADTALGEKCLSNRQIQTIVTSSDAPIGKCQLIPRLPLRATLVALAALALATAAAAQDNPIIARMTQFVEAYNAQDAAAIARFYSPDAVLLPPGQVSVQGREAIAQHYAQAFAAGARDLQFQTFDIRATDAMAVEIGETVVMVGEQRIVGRYMHLWQVVEGQLFLTRDMYHVLAVE
jgi:uncharacterized protein (TIGR02246 family)